MTTRQTSYQMDTYTEAYVLFLKDRGFGNNTNILREAVKRMAQEEGYRTMNTEFLIVHSTAGVFREARWHNDRSQPGNWKTFNYQDGEAGTLPDEPGGPAWPGDDLATVTSSGYRSRWTG